MSIEKLDFTQVKKERLPFTTILNCILQNIKHPQVLGIYVYLASLPDEWTVNKKHICNHFEISDEKLSKILCWLNKNLLISYERTRDQNGKFLINSCSIVVKNGLEFMSIVKQKSDLTPKENSSINEQISTALKIQGVEQTPINTAVVKEEENKNKPLSVDNFKTVDNFQSTTPQNPHSGFSGDIYKNKINNKNNNNNNNIYINNNKNMYKKETDVNKQGIIKSTRSKELLEFKDKSTPAQAKKFFEALPPHLRPKRYVQLESNALPLETEKNDLDETIKSNVSQSQSQGATISSQVIPT